MKKNLAIIGHGGHAQFLREFLSYDSEYLFKGYISKDPDSNIAFSEQNLPELLHKDIQNLVLGVGLMKSINLRNIVQKYLNLKFNFPIFKHPSAITYPSVKIGPGTLLLENSLVKSNSTLGSFTLINSHAVVSHDCKISNFVHISLGAKLGGGIEIGEHSFIGINASLKENIKIGKNVIIGAGSVVLNDISDNSIAVGSPARTLSAS